MKRALLVLAGSVIVGIILASIIPSWGMLLGLLLPIPAVAYLLLLTSRSLDEMTTLRIASALRGISDTATSDAYRERRFRSGRKVRRNGLHVPLAVFKALWEVSRPVAVVAIAVPVAVLASGVVYLGADGQFATAIVGVVAVTAVLLVVGLALTYTAAAGALTARDYVDPLLERGEYESAVEVAADMMSDADFAAWLTAAVDWDPDFGAYVARVAAADSEENIDTFAEE